MVAIINTQQNSNLTSLFKYFIPEYKGSSYAKRCVQMDSNMCFNLGRCHCFVGFIVASVLIS